MSPKIIGSASIDPFSKETNELFQSAAKYHVNNGDRQKAGKLINQLSDLKIEAVDDMKDTISTTFERLATVSPDDIAQVISILFQKSFGKLVYDHREVLETLVDMYAVEFGEEITIESSPERRKEFEE